MEPLMPDPSTELLLDLQDERLWRGGQVIPLSPKAFAMLRYFVTHPERLLTKEMLLDSVWPGLYVTESQVKQVVQQLRRALGDNPRTPRFIETVHRRGYRFIGTIKTRDNATAVAASEPRLEQGTPAPRVLGRAQEMNELGRWLGHALAGERRIGFVTGEAGIGKSTLIGAFLQDAAKKHDLRVVIGQCFEYFGAQEPYMPIFEALEELCAESDGARVAELLRRHAPGWVQHMPWLHDNAADESLPSAGVSSNREGMLRELAQVLEELSRDKPLVLWLDDLHWADHSTLELVAYLGQRRQRAHLLVLGSFRHEEAQRVDCPLSHIQFDLLTRRRCRVIALPLLDTAAVAAYTEARMPQLPPATIRHIHRHTDGHPLFLVHMLDYLSSQGLQVSPDGPGDEPELGVPETLRELIGQGIARLPPEQHRLLEACSVAGTHFCAATIAGALGQDLAIIEEQCEKMVRAGSYLCRYGEDLCRCADGTVSAQYQFRHSLYRETLYQRVLPGRQVLLHRLIGERLERALGERAAEAATELALHFERGGVPLRALNYVEQAAEHALRCYAYSEAVMLLRRALALLRDLPELPQHARRELALQLALMTPLTAISGYTTLELEQTLTRAVTLCRELDDQATLVGPLRGLHSIYLHRGEYGKARELADDLLAMAIRAGSASQLTDAQTLSGITHLFMGRFAAAREELEPIPADFDRPPLAPAVSSCTIDSRVYRLTQAALVLWLLGYPDRALARSDEALAFAETLSNPFYLAAAVDFRKFLHMLRGEVGAVAELVESRAKMFKERDLQYLAMAQRLHRGWVQMMQGDVQAGHREMREALSGFAANRAVTRLLHNLPQLAEACWRSGLTAEGLAAVDEAFALTEQTGMNLWEAELYRLKGELLLQGGERNAASQAERCFRKSLAVAHRQHARSLALRSATSLARLLPEGEKKRQAAEQLTRIYRSFTEGSETRDLREADALLHHLRCGVWHGRATK